MWYVGTFTLAGVTIGALIGVVIDAIPLATTIGLAIGVALDSYLRDRSAADEG